MKIRRKVNKLKQTKQKKMAAPVILSLSNQQGNPNTSLIINGSGFNQGGLTVYFGTYNVSYQAYNDTSISLTVPVIPGQVYSITVVNNGGTSNAMNYTVNPINPTINAGNYTGFAGNNVTITGTEFSYFITPIVTLKYLNGRSSYSATVVSYTNTSITFTIPSVMDRWRYADIKVNNGLNGEVVATNALIVKAAPIITSFTPTSSAFGGSVTITGSNFILPNGGWNFVNDVRFGGVSNSLNTTFPASETSITTTVPDGAIDGNITVHTDCGIGSKSGFVCTQGLFNRITNIGSGSLLQNPQYSLNNGSTWQTFSSNVVLNKNTTVRFRGTFVNNSSFGKPCSIQTINYGTTSGYVGAYSTTTLTTNLITVVGNDNITYKI